MLSFLYLMRKFLMLVFSVALLSACSFGKDSEKLKDPQASFDDLTAKNRQAWQETILDMLPNMKSFDLAQTKFTVFGNAKTDETGGAINFNVTADSQVDASNAEDPKMDATVNVKGNIDSGAYKGTASASLNLMIANSHVFANLKALEVNFPNVPTSEILAPVKQIIGKWYGDSFDTIAAQTGQNLKIKEAFSGNIKGPGVLRQEIATIIAGTDVFTMTEYLGPENGFQKFNVTVDNEKLRTSAEQIIDLMITAEAEKTAAKNDLQAKIANTDITGVLGLQQDDPKYFTFEGDVKNTQAPEKNSKVSISFLKDKKTFAIADAAAKTHSTLQITSTGDSSVFSIIGGKTAEENITILEGSKSATSFTATITNPDDNQKKATIALTKAAEVWSGTVTTQDKPDTVIQIENMTFDQTTFKATFIVKTKETAVANINLAYEIKEIQSLTLTPPASYEPFGNLLQNFLPLMMMGAPGLGGAQTGGLEGSPRPSDLPLGTEDAVILSTPDAPANTADIPQIEPDETDLGLPEPPAVPAGMTAPEAASDFPLDASVTEEIPASIGE